MARTTINLEDSLFGTLEKIAQRDNRSTPNLIETILKRHLDENYDVDEIEMQEINRDKQLKSSIQKSLADYKNKRGSFV